MSKFVVVIFPTEAKAYEGTRALKELHAEASLAVYGMAVVTKGADGKLTVKQSADAGPLGMGVGALVGGLTGLRSVARLAAEAGVAFTPHTWGNGIGQIANAHLTAGLADAPYLEFPYDPPEWDLDRRDYMLAEPCRVDGQGWINLSEAPGLGLVLDEAALARTRL